MDVKLFCPIWGLVPDYINRIEAPMKPVLEKIKAAGYNGIEMAVPLDSLTITPEFGPYPYMR